MREISERIEVVVGDLLRLRGLTLALAESCTGGLVSSRITDVPGSSDYFLGGVVAYANALKANVLGVPEDILAACGAVSAETAVAMANGVKGRLGSDIGMGITGLAGPAGGTAEKPVGLVYVALAHKEERTCMRHLFSGDRLQIKRQSSEAALALLKGFLKAASE